MKNSLIVIMTGHNTKSQISGILLVITYILCTAHSSALSVAKLVYPSGFSIKFEVDGW